MEALINDIAVGIQSEDWSNEILLKFSEPRTETVKNCSNVKDSVHRLDEFANAYQVWIITQLDNGSQSIQDGSDKSSEVREDGSMTSRAAFIMSLRQQTTQSNNTFVPSSSNTKPFKKQQVKQKRKISAETVGVGALSSPALSRNTSLNNTEDTFIPPVIPLTGSISGISISSNGTSISNNCDAGVVDLRAELRAIKSSQSSSALSSGTAFKSTTTYFSNARLERGSGFSPSDNAKDVNIDYTSSSQVQQISSSITAESQQVMNASNNRIMLIIDRMSRIYSLMVVNQYITILEYLTLLLKLLRVNVPSSSFSQILRHQESQPPTISKSPTSDNRVLTSDNEHYLARDSNATEFLRILVEQTINIVKGFGRYIIQDIVTRLWHRNHTKLAHELTDYIDNIDPESLHSQSSYINLTDQFLKPFRSGEDSRLETRSKASLISRYYDDDYNFNENKIVYRRNWDCIMSGRDASMS